MTTARTNALNEIIELSLERGRLTIPDVLESIDGDTSRRTIRRAFKDAEEYGWVTKQGTDASDWMRGETARQYLISDKVAGYPHDNFPIMYFVVGSSTPQAFMDGENVLASAGVAWLESGTGFSIGIPDANHLMIDSGGYQAATRFGDEYPYSPKELHVWADSVNADVVWGMDWACEDKEVLSDNTGVPKSEIADWEWRFDKSWTDQVVQFEHWQQGRYNHEFRPVVQGHDPPDFEQFAKKLRDSALPHDRIGIGTVCKREKSDVIYEVVSNVRDILPDSKIHLFGATMRIWKQERFDGLFESSDSAAWLRHDPNSGMYAEDKQAAYENYKQKIVDTTLGRKS